MTDLIVDFPNRSASASKSGKKLVQFSPTSELKLFKQDSSVEARWFSQKEYREMKMANRRAVQTAYRRYLSISSGNSSDWHEPFDPSSMVGIENMLTPGLIKKSQAARERRLRAVLSEQERQDEAGEYDPDKLAQVSQTFSKWSTKRASTIGLLQQK